MAGSSPALVPLGRAGWAALAGAHGQPSYNVRLDPPPLRLATRDCMATAIGDKPRRLDSKQHTRQVDTPRWELPRANARDCPRAIPRPSMPPALPPLCESPAGCATGPVRMACACRTVVCARPALRLPSGSARHWHGPAGRRPGPVPVHDRYPASCYPLALADWGSWAHKRQERKTRAHAIHAPQPRAGRADPTLATVERRSRCRCPGTPRRQAGPESQTDVTADRRAETGRGDG